MRARIWVEARERQSAAFVGTIHAFCRRLLHIYGYEQQVARESGVSFSHRLLRETFLTARTQILESSAESEFIRNRLFPEGGSLRNHDLQKLVLGLIGHVRDRDFDLNELARLTVERLQDDPNRDLSLAVTRAAQWTTKAYRDLRVSEQILDSHDILALAVRLVTDGQTCQRIAQRYQFLVVDEFQDTDALQMDLITLLQLYLKGFMIVGDRKQSIYYFRGARHDLLEEAARKFTHGPPLLLSTSRRARPDVISAQNALFASMAEDTLPANSGWSGLKEPLSPDLNRRPRAMSENLPPLRYVRASSKIMDREALVRSTLHGVQSLVNRGFELGEIALLFRSNKVMTEYLQAFRRVSIPARSSLGETFYAQPEIMTVYRILRCLLQPDDDAALLMALQTPPLREAQDVDFETELLRSGPEERSLTRWFKDQPLTGATGRVYAQLAELRRRPFAIRSQASSDGSTATWMSPQRLVMTRPSLAALLDCVRLLEALRKARMRSRWKCLRNRCSNASSRTRTRSESSLRRLSPPGEASRRLCN